MLASELRGDFCWCARLESGDAVRIAWDTDAAELEHAPAPEPDDAALSVRQQVLLDLVCAEPAAETVEAR